MEAKFDQAKLKEIIKSYPAHKSSLISVLQDVQQELNYLPEEVLKIISRKLKVALSQVYNVSTFYNTFSLTPRGKHLINVCLGTACHVRGGQRIMETFERKLGVGNRQTTKDLKFSLESVNCLGACALGPVVVIDGEIFGQVTPRKVDKILAGFM